MNRVNHTKSFDYKFWLGLLISGLFLYLAIRKVDLYRTWTIIRASDLSLLMLVVVITFIQYVLRSFRWDILFR